MFHLFNKEKTQKAKGVSPFYAISHVWRYSKKRVICDILQPITGYMEWVFFSAFFMRFIVEAIEAQTPFWTIVTYIALAELVLLIFALFRTWAQSTVNPVTDRIIYRGLYTELYNKAANVELGCFENPDFYNKYTLAAKDAQTTLLAAEQSFFGAVCGGIASIVVFVVMFDVDKYAAIFVLFPLIGNFVFNPKENREANNIIKESAKANRKTDYVNRALHLADFAKELRLSNIFSVLQRMYKSGVDESVKIAKKHSGIMVLWYWLRVNFTYTFIFQGVLVYGVYRAGISKTMSLTELVILSSLMVAATWILIGFANDLVESNKNFQLLENVKTFLSYKETIPEDYDGITADKTIDSIEFRDVTFGYVPNKPVIKNLSFIIKGKSAIALVGHNGAGKSTIIKLLLRMYDPDSGEILLNGKNIKEYNLYSYRTLFSGAFQDFKLFAASVRENIIMHKVDHSPEETEKVTNALKKAGVWDRVMAMPNGIESELTREFSEEGIVLSGGESQKIAVARSFAGNAPVHIFDEPSSALDPIAEAELYDSIMEDSREKTALFISHRLSSVRNANMVFMLENGTIIERGSHKELMKINGAYADMYTKQAKNYLAQNDDVSVTNTEVVNER